MHCILIVFICLLHLLVHPTSYILTPPLPPPFFLSPDSPLLLKRNKTKQKTIEPVRVDQLVLGMGLALECGQYIKCHSVKENGISLSWHQYKPIAPQLGMRLCGTSPPPFWDSVWMECVQVMCMSSQALSVNMCICLLCPEKLPWRHWLPLALKIFLYHLPHESWALKGKIRYRYPI